MNIKSFYHPKPLLIHGLNWEWKILIVYFGEKAKYEYIELGGKSFLALSKYRFLEIIVLKEVFDAGWNTKWFLK